MSQGHSQDVLGRLFGMAGVGILFLIFAAGMLMHFGMLLAAPELSRCGSTTWFTVILFASPLLCWLLVHVLIAVGVEDGVAYVIGAGAVLLVLAIELWFFMDLSTARAQANTFRWSPQAFQEAMQATRFCRFFSPLF